MHQFCKMERDEYMQKLVQFKHKLYGFLVYLDPPYRPITDTANFTAYTENLFNDEEQIELARFVDDMHRKGAKIVISNSDPKNFNTEDNFFDNIYSSYKIRRVDATRMINCNSEARGKIKELLISNF